MTQASGITAPFLAILIAALLGIRHGIDWDHIAAITDVTSGAPSYRRGVLMGTMYAFGHSAVVVVLGLLSVLLGLDLPESVNGFMQPVVGVTLILLGAWILYSLLRAPERFHMRSRWMLVADGLRAAVRWVRRDVHEPLRHSGTTYGWKTALTVGMIHGIGAETPTQILLFVSAAGAGGKAIALGLVTAFVAGLFVSNTAISFASVFGYVSATRRRSIYLGAGAVTGCFSLVVGALFLTGRAAMLPALLGG